MRVPPLPVRLYALGAMAAFGTSLVCGVWLYVWLGRPVGAASARQGVVAVTADLLLFGLFALHHSLFARTGAKAWLNRRIPPSLERSTYVWIASLLFLLVAFAWQPVPGLWYQVEGWPRWLLYALQGSGLALTVLGARAINPRDLGGVSQAWDYERADSTAPPANPLPANRVPARPVLANPDPFVTHGAYGLVRHPIYLGWFLMVWPTPLMTGGRLTFAAVSSLYLLVAIPFEERSLLDIYGDAYRRYRRQVRWRVLPGLY
jgi:protein-S-isoprenylcysteine O-methyltransferase Ste14